MVPPSLRSSVRNCPQSMLSYKTIKKVIHFRYLATGESLQSLSFSFRIGRSTISSIISDVCRAIWTNLADQHIKMPQTTNEWQEISNEFYNMWQFPNCLGAIDGKHVVITAPPNTGSVHFNYKGTFSVVLMALVDSHAKFRYIDVGAYGRNSDGGIFRNSSLGKSLQNHLLSIPIDRPLPLAQNEESLPFVFLADEAFPLQRHIMRPYPGTNLSPEKKAFNYRLSRGRRIVENAFGILAQRFRIFHTKIKASTPKITEIIKACCLLHNLVNVKDDPDILPGVSQNEGQITRMEPDTEAIGDSAQEVRDKLKD